MEVVKFEKQTCLHKTFLLKNYVACKAPLAYSLQIKAYYNMQTSQS